MMISKIMQHFFLHKTHLNFPFSKISIEILVAAASKWTYYTQMQKNVISQINTKTFGKPEVLNLLVTFTS